jgi:predicted nuclease of predicted toxin-antitoxin system
MKLLLDMNLSPRLEPLLAEAGVEAVHWSLVGRGDATDAEIMAHARALGFVVVTRDLDFGAILAATGAEGPSVIQVRGLDQTPEALVGPVLAAQRQCAEALAEGAIVTIDTERLRLRLLPFERR